MIRFLKLISFAAGAVALTLRSSDELTSDCYNFPAQDFTRENCVKCTYGASPHIVLTEGSTAIDFTLPDLNGKLYTLSDLLEDKPVLLLYGMYTCPAYQGLGTTQPFDQCSYTHEYDMVEEYKDSVTFVHVYGPEPHPMLPYANFDSGKPLLNYWSTVSQPQTWSERVTMAQKISGDMHPDTLLLVDYLQGNPYSTMNNPVWCSYAHGARSVVLIGMDGTVQYTRDWLRTDNVKNAIKAYLKTL